MPKLPSIPKIALLLPIVVAVCALMVLPAGTVVGSLSTTGAASAISTGTSLAVPGPAVVSAPAAGTSTVSLSPTAPSDSSLFSQLPASVSRAPWVQSLTHQGPGLLPLTSVPNFALLEHPQTTAGPVNPFYVAQPAPLGLADYGLGATTYSYNVSRLMGQVTFNAPPNVTDPSSDGLIEPSGQHDGNVGSVYEFGIQLNTVATNMSIPGSDQGFFWTQNVVNWNDTGIHFVDDTFNLTSGTQNPFVIESGTIYSACHNSTAGIDRILYNYGGVFQCVGGTIPLTPASYPVTIQLFNNASVNAQNRTQVSYGYRIMETGTGTLYTGISDTIVFNSPGAPHAAPANTPGFSIDGFSGAPAGLFRDAEIVLVGDIGGDNSVFRSLAGAVNLEYTNASTGGWQNVPSAYNWGGDTGETSTGIADYWTASHTLHINQGPAMLYGLWNAAPWASVKSGDIHLAGTISPSYGFVFVGNTHPIFNPWVVGHVSNMSWLPTSNSGAFSTYLPPLGAPWTSSYFVQGFADGFAEKNGTAVTGSTTTYALNLRPSPGTLNAPLYAFSNAQASSLAKHVTGSAAPPYDFNGLTVNVNFSFNHVNDYGYPEFVLFMTQGVTNPVEVNDTFQGQDSAAGNFYIYDFAPGGASTGIVTPGPITTGSLPYFTSGINIFGGHNDRITNQTVAASGYGLQVNLWGDTDAWVSNVVSEYDGAGVFVGDSTGTTVTGVTAYTGGTGITDIGSTHTTGSEIVAVGSLGVGHPSVGVYGYTSSHGTFSWVWASGGAVGVATGEDYGIAGDYDPYYYLPGTTDLAVSDVFATNGSVGANITLSQHTTVAWVWDSDGSVGVVTDDAARVSVSNVETSVHSTGVSLFNSQHATVTATAAWIWSTGVLVNDSRTVTVTWVFAWDNSTGVNVTDSSGVSVAHVLASDYSTGVYVTGSTGVTIRKVTAINHSVGIYIAS
jgi:hypothetical protein